MRTDGRPGKLCRLFPGSPRLLGGIFAVSGIINVLGLTGSFYMLQVYDRVLASRSLPTLAALSLLAVGLYLLQGVLEIIRSQILVRSALLLNLGITPRAHGAVIQSLLKGGSGAKGTEALRDLDNVSRTISEPALLAFLDLPWMPLYVAFIFMLHPGLGLLALTCATLLVSLAIIAERRTKELEVAATGAGLRRQHIADANARNVEVIRAMGMEGRVAERFGQANAHFLAIQTRASDVTGSFAGASRVIRMMLQSATLGCGAYLTLEGAMSAGAIVAASIAVSRALAPIEIAISQWRKFIAARQSLTRLTHALESTASAPLATKLPPPSASLELRDVAIAAPSGERLILQDVNLTLRAGEGLGVIGSSAAGKSSLVRAITGIWPARKGSIRLDGACLDRWPADELGRHFGYLPQEVELFEGTIAENIARLAPQPCSEAVLAAARAAGVHDLILNLPEAYETRLGPGGAGLSVGQRQRIALARALYGDPFLVVLDEPNSNLDVAGEAALTSAIRGIRARGGIVVIVSHRPNAIAAVDLIAVVKNGTLASWGSKPEVLKGIARPKLRSVS